MGYQFPIQAGNIVAYLTAPKGTPAPRLTKFEVESYLRSLVDEPDRFISSREDWIAKIDRAARKAINKLDRVPGEASHFLNPEEIEEVLFDFRELLGDYRLFVLVAGTFQNNRELRAFAEHAAFSTGGDALVLYPELSAQDIRLLDPFPFVAQILQEPENWPGVAFWNKNGSFVFCPLAEAGQIFAEITLALRSDDLAVNALLNGYRRKRRGKRLLHLSDLHFGRVEAFENQAYLTRHLETAIGNVDRTVITGDLFDNPKRQDAIAFRNFRDDLAVKSGRDVLVVPGNHDQKWFGNFKSTISEIAKLEWSTVIADDDLECNFMCFDSARDAKLARGKITRQQLLDTATEFERQCAIRSDRRGYLSVALVHHHPFSFEAQQETLVQKLLSLVGLTDETFLQMEDAEGFLSWCASRNVPLILHGHKHVQRHVQKFISTSSGQSRQISAVGCGTSLGAEGMALSYNVLSWDPVSRKWSVSFFADPGDGSGFTQQLVALHELA